MIWLRSTVCNLILLCWTIACGIGGLPYLLLRRPVGGLVVFHFWGRGMIWLPRIICGVKWKVEGEIPKDKVIIASKHESAWETIIFYPLLRNPVFVLKRELLWIPIIGWYVWALDSIAINRKAGKKALFQVIEQSTEKLQQGRSVIIFPEGTRVKHGTRRKYHSGVAGIYEKAGVPIVPVALNSGVCWPKNSWKKYPGTITLRFLEPIPVGLPREEAMRLVEERIEAGQAEL